MTLKLKLLLPVLLLLTAAAQAINVSMHDTDNFVQNQVIKIPVYVTDLTGQNVLSFLSTITYDASVLSCTGATRTGTISSSWAVPTVNINNTAGVINIASFGTAPLTGSGILVYLNFTVIGAAGKYSKLSFTSFQFNEGIPAVDFTNGKLFVGPLHLTSPLGGEVWQAGSQHNITWASTGISNVKLEYTTDSGTSWSTITASTPASSGSFVWTLPNTASAVYQIKISDASNSSTASVSAVFSVCKLNLTSPIGGEIWQAGSQQNITWSSSLVTNVKLEYSSDSGTNWTTIIVSTLAGAGSYAWTLPNTASTTYKIKISDASNSLITAASAVFTVSKLVLLSPLGGEIWQAGSLHYITWTGTGVANVKLEYTSDNGVNWNTIAVSTSAGAGSYAWTVPDNISSSYQIKISDVSNSLVTLTSAAFTVCSISVLTPLGTDIWQAGSLHNITWNSSLVTIVKLEYSSDSGTNWSTIIASTAASAGSYAWTVPNTASAAYQVKISNVSSSSVTATSAVFTVCQLNLSSPVGAETWQAGSLHNITWSSSLVTNVKIEYSSDGGTNWTSITASISASAVSYAWTVPNTASTTYKIKISDVSNSSVSAVSSVFTVSKLALLGPVGGEVWQAGSQHNITWTSVGVTNVKLEYSSDNGVNWTSIIASTSASAGSYLWTLPSSASAVYLVKISDALYTSLMATSAVFTVSKLNLLSPVGGEMWQAGSQHNIIWSSGLVTNVKLEYTSDNGSNWTTISASTIASAGSYAWAVPNVVSTNYQVKITDITNSSITAISSVFTVSKLVLSAPLGGEVWRAGSQHNITWTGAGITNVKLEYTSDNGTSWNTIIASTAASAGSYAWTLPNVTGSAYQVKISDVANLSVISTSTVFTVCSLSLTSPVGGEVWRSGTQHNITWSSSLVTNVKLEYSSDNGVNWTSIIASTSASAGSYVWTLPTSASTFYQVKVSDASSAAITATSVVFTVIKLDIVTPNGGERIQSSNPYNITWSVGGLDLVKLEYTSNNGTSWTVIDNNIAASPASYSWGPPASPGTNFKVRISSSSDASITSMSSATFAVFNGVSVLGASPYYYYPLNGTSNDIVSGNNGIMSGASSASDRFETSSGAVSLNNTTSSIELPDKFFFGADKASHSFSFWFYPTSTEGLIWGKSGNLQSTALQMLTGGQLYFQWAHPAPGSPSTAVYSDAQTATGVISQNAWNHVAVNYTNSLVTFYINGQAVSTANRTLDNSHSVTDNTKTYSLIDWGQTVGGSANGKNGFGSVSDPTLGNGSFTGKLDEVKIYDTSLTVSLIRQLYSLDVIKLTTFNAGGDFVPGVSYAITWKSLQTSTLKLEYSTDNGTNWTAIGTGVIASLGTYAWTIPYALSTNCKLRITDETDALKYAVSTSSFTIINQQPSVSSMKTAASTGSNSIKFGDALVTVEGFWKALFPVTVTYYPGTAPPNSTIPSGFVRLSNYYWNVNVPGNTINSGGAISCSVIDLPGVVNPLTVKWLRRMSESDPWINLGSNYATGTLKSAVSFTNFGEFALGTTNAENPLPVELSSFRAQIIRHFVRFTWETATEITNSEYRLERTKTPLKYDKDGKVLHYWGAWVAVQKLKGAGTSYSPKTYTAYDRSVIENGVYGYRLLQVDYDGKENLVTETEVDLDFTPTTFVLEQNYPNPFNPSTTIKYGLPVNSHITINIYNSLGQLITKVADEVQTAGYHTAVWNGSNFASGIYFYELKAEGFKTVKKLMLVK